VKGKTGRLNASEPLMMPRHVTAPRMGSEERGAGTEPLRGGKRRLWDATSSRRTPLFPGYRRQPPQSNLVRVQRDNPVEVQAPVGVPVARP
jgi:hypothetical protein